MLNGIIHFSTNFADIAPIYHHQYNCAHFQKTENAFQMKKDLF